jgi:hypothetical protein
VTAREYQWRGRSDFAEIAEALGVRSDQVMAAEVGGELTLVLYTQDEEPTLVWAAVLRRGVDDVLFITAPPQPRPGLWESIVEQMERP